MQRSTQDWTIDEIGAHLKMKGVTYRSLDRATGKKPDTIRNALYRSIPSYEAIIADAIGVSPAEIWPSRYANKNPHQNKRVA